MLRSLTLPLVAIAVIVSARFASGADPAPPTFDELKTLMSVTQDNREPIEYSFTATFPTGVNECHYARRGEAFYGGVKQRNANGGIMPSEGSWDGKRGYSHSGLGIVAVKSDREYAKPGSMMLEEQLMFPVYTAYGISKDKGVIGASYTFRSIELESPTVAVATFDFQSGPRAYQFKIWHQLDKAGWPLRTRLIDPLGAIAVEVTDIEFSSTIKDSVWSGYPIALTVNAANDQVRSPMVYRVDLATLLTGDKVRSDFTIEPFPFESLSDLDANKMGRPKNKNWLSDGPLRFPFTELYESHRARQIQARPTTGPAPKVP